MQFFEGLGLIRSAISAVYAEEQRAPSRSISQAFRLMTEAEQLIIQHMKSMPAGPADEASRKQCPSSAANEEHQLHTRAEDWQSMPGNYGATTRAACPWCNAANALVLEGQSHDEEPSIGTGNWHCEACSREGDWDGKQDDVIGPTGFSTPGPVRLFNPSR